MEIYKLEFSKTAKSITLFFLLGITGYLLICILKPFLMPIIWAIILAIFVYPLQRRLNHRFTSKNLSALLGLIITVGVVIVPGGFLLLQLSHELNSLYHRISDQQELDQILQWLKHGNLSTWLEQHFGFTLTDLRQILSGSIDKVSNIVAGYITGLISNSVLLFIKSFLVIFTLFFLLRDGEGFLDWLLKTLPLTKDQQQQLIKLFQDVINATLFGNLIIALTQGSLAGLMFYLVGIPKALLWTIVMVGLSMIPLVGSTMIWLPAAVWLIISGEMIKGIVLLLWGIFVVGLIDNFLRPLLVARQTRLHTIVTFYAVLGGLKLCGPIGIVIGPLVIAAFLMLLDFIIYPSANEEADLTVGVGNKEMTGFMLEDR